MTTYYSVLRPVTQADLDTAPGMAEVLKMIPPNGTITFEQFRHLKNGRAGRGLAHACSIGVLKRVSPHERILGLDTVKFWLTQLNKPGFKNLASKDGTMRTYLGLVAKFDAWLPGRNFPARNGGNGQAGAHMTFQNVEELLKYCDEPDYNPRTVKRVMREYLTSPQVAGMSDVQYSNTRSAIKSYFVAHDIEMNMPKPRKKRSETDQDDDYMTLEDFYKMLHNGRPSIMMRAIMLIKLQSGMDAATLADRFNFEGYPQIVKYFKTDDHKSWDLGRCPIPIKTVRVKTSMRYMTFLDHDAIVQLQEYLTWKEAKYGKQDASEPLFLTKRKNPIRPMWVSTGFSEVAVRAGIQKKVSHSVFMMRSHMVRHLLKSTLITSGCAQYAAEHVLGHAPRDPYEKQAILYPEMLRAEYAKASSRLNIISKVENNLNSTEDPESQDARIQELEAEVAALKQSKAGEDFTDEKHKNTMNGMNEKINRLLRLFDALPDDIKDKMPDEIDD